MRNESHRSPVLPGHPIRGLRARWGSGDLARRTNLDSQPFRDRTTARDDPAGHYNSPRGTLARRTNLDSQPFRDRTTARDDPPGHYNSPRGALAY